MDARSQQILEFPQIRERLAGQTAFGPSRRLAQALTPSDVPIVVARGCSTNLMRLATSSRGDPTLAWAARTTFAFPPEGLQAPEVKVGARIGVDYAGDWKDRALRFWLRDNPAVSRG